MKQKIKKTIERVIFITILLLAAALCLVVATRNKKTKNDPVRTAYDSTIKDINVKVKLKQDTINELNKKKDIYHLSLKTRKANIYTITARLDTATIPPQVDSLIDNYKYLAKDYERVDSLNDSIIIKKNEQLKLQDIALKQSQNEIKRIDTALQNKIAENVKLYDQVARLEKKLNRRKKVTTILIGTILAFGYIVVK